MDERPFPPWHTLRDTETTIQYFCVFRLKISQTNKCVFLSSVMLTVHDAELTEDPERRHVARWSEDTRVA